MHAILRGNLKSRTSWAAFLLIVLGAIQQSGVLEFVPTQYYGLSLSIVGALVFFLRQITGQSITDKGAQ